MLMRYFELSICLSIAKYEGKSDLPDKCYAAFFRRAGFVFGVDFSDFGFAWVC